MPCLIFAKKGVRIALRYPAKHKTPSLDENTWTYWIDCFRMTAVVFGKNKKVVQIR